MQNISDTFDMGWHNSRYKKHAQYKAPSPIYRAYLVDIKRVDESDVKTVD